MKVEEFKDHLKLVIWNWNNLVREIQLSKEQEGHSEAKNKKWKGNLKWHKRQDYDQGVSS